VSKDGLFITGAQQLLQNFSLHMYEILFSYTFFGFAVKEYLMRNNKMEENSGILYLIVSGKIAQYTNLCFR